MSMCRNVWIILGVAVVTSLAGLALAGRFLAAPAVPAVKADLAVALGGDGGSRVQTVAELYAQGLVSRILLTGIDQGDLAGRPKFLEWRAALLIERGVPTSALLFDHLSANSWQEARGVRALMECECWKSVVVVSDPPHLRRLSWVWSRAFHGSGFEYHLVASRMRGWNEHYWWPDDKSGQFVLMELIKLTYYMLRYRGDGL